MRALLLFLVAFTGGQSAAKAADTVVYRNLELPFTFEHPATWIEEKPRKKSKHRNETRFQIPTGGAGEPALLEIFAISFRADKELWQTSQLDVNKDLKREVTNQWQEEILGVPLLLTELSYTDKGVPTKVLAGLIYSRDPRKFNFRLTAPATGYDNALAQFRASLQSMKTLDGTMPKVEDPSRKALPDEDKNTRLTYNRSIISSAPPVKASVKGSVVLTAQAAGKKLDLRLPGGWKGQAEGNGYVITRAGLPGSLRLQVSSTLDSEQPQTAMLNLAAKDLSLYKTVAYRDEVSPQLNLAGATIARVWRNGDGEKGSLATSEGYALTGDYYAFLTYRYDGAVKPDQRKLIDELIGGMSVEPAP